MVSVYMRMVHICNVKYFNNDEGNLSVMVSYSLLFKKSRISIEIYIVYIYIIKSASQDEILRISRVI